MTGTLIGVAEAQRLVVERTGALAPERVPIERAFGRVLAETVRATIDLPPFPSVAMDGYALRASDTASPPASLRVTGAASAGTPAATAVGPGEAIEVSTGAVLPGGADAVVPLEAVTAATGGITVPAPVQEGANVRPRAGDIEAGAVVLGPGTLLGGAQVGALAAAGIAEVQCTKRPRVGILVTGSELRAPGSDLAPGEIYESNGLMLAGLLTAAGAVPAQLGVVPDVEEEHRRAMERAMLGFDMLVTSGGASVGPHDLVRRVQAELRVEEVFWGVAMRPGKPVAFGTRRDHVLFNLPGNPVSALVCFELLVRPAVNALLGIPDPLPRFSSGTLASAVAANDQRDEFLRARLEWRDGAPVLDPLSGQESHMITAAAHAGALVAVTKGSGELPAGSTVPFLPLA